MASLKKEKIDWIEIGKIDEPGGIIRMKIDPDKIDALAENIKEIGQLQPILIRPKGERYEIVFGHRRFLATQKIGKARILSMVKDLDDKTTALMRATENIEREDISPIEEAAVYKDLIENLGMTIAQVAKRMGKSEAIIKRRTDLLRMPPCLQKAVHEKEIGYSVAEELWRLGELPDIEYYLGYAVDHGATLAVVRLWVNEKLGERRRQEDGTEGMPRHTTPMETRPIYVSCDTCQGPMEIGEETVIRCCRTCYKALKIAMEGGEK